jgi:hypothetical protein
LTSASRRDGISLSQYTASVYFLESGKAKVKLPACGWLERHADVIEREKGQGAYRIKREFYDAMEEVFR